VSVFLSLSLDRDVSGVSFLQQPCRLYDWVFPSAYTWQCPLLAAIVWDGSRTYSLWSWYLYVTVPLLLLLWGFATSHSKEESQNVSFFTSGKEPPNVLLLLVVLFSLKPRGRGTCHGYLQLVQQVVSEWNLRSFLPPPQGQTARA